MFWHVREVENYALSKFQPPTTLGDHQNFEKTIWEEIDFGRMTDFILAIDVFLPEVSTARSIEDTYLDCQYCHFLY